MNKRKPVAIFALFLGLVIIVMTSIPGVYGSKPLWAYVFDDDLLPLGIFGLLFTIATFVLDVFAFIKKDKAKLFITLSVISFWLGGTIFTFGGNYYAWVYSLMCYFVLFAIALIWNLVLKNKAEPQNENSTKEAKPKSGIKKGFFKQWSRSNGIIYGDIEGPMTKLKRGSMAITIEDGKCIAFLLGAGGFELSKDTVKSLELIEEHLPADIANRHYPNDEADYYQITMADGQVGTLRLVCSTADKVLDLISGGSDETEEASIMDGLDEQTKAVLTFHQRAAESPDSPIGKTLDWFQSEKGLEVYKEYTTPKNFLLQSRYIQEFKTMLAGEKSNIDFDRHYLPAYYPDAKLPRTYFKALLESLGAEAVKNDIVRDYLLDTIMAVIVPYTIDEDGEPVPSDVSLSPAQVLSIDKNPLLYFVKNFDVFNFEQDDLGGLTEKFIIYMAAVKFILPLWGVGALNNVEEIRWLLDKDTYINEFGMLRKIKGFIKKCKELTDNADYHKQLDIVLEQLLAEMEKTKKE